MARRLGIVASYSDFEAQTLRHRITEAKHKLQQVRKYVHNRRIASTMSRLKVWMSVIWPTLSFGLAETGVSAESAKLLKSWYARKIRSALNKPVHVTRITTSELFALYSIEDPVAKLHKQQVNRRDKLQMAATCSMDITCSLGASPLGCYGFPNCKAT